jgi:hypothetical protein
MLVTVKAKLPVVVLIDCNLTCRLWLDLEQDTVFRFLDAVHVTLLLDDGIISLGNVM